jgi:hypothetical protein
MSSEQIATETVEQVSTTVSPPVVDNSSVEYESVRVPVENEVANEVPTAPVETKTNFSQQVAYSAKLEEDEFDYGDELAIMPSGLQKDVTAKIKDIPKVRLAETANGREWIAAINGGLQTSVYQDGLELSSKRVDAQWQQGVESETGILTGAVTTFKVKEGVKYTGEQARLRIRQGLKLGSIFNAPLWHSGFWIRLKAPSEGDLLELYRQINAEKISLGRASYGLLFSNNTSYASSLLLNFCIEHLYESSLTIAEGDSIAKYIKTPDLPILLWCITNAIWPNGFQYTRACISDPEKCDFVVKEKLDLSKLQWTDKTSLTKHQINHMTKRGRGSMDVESLKRYNDEFIRGQMRKVELSKEVSITLKVPTVIEHIDAGYRWVNAIEENYGKALIQDENTRDDYLISQGKATVMRQYAHFVHSITINGDEIDDVDTIENILNDLTSSDKIRTAFMDKTAQYLDDAIVSMIAIPTYICPSCGGNQQMDKSKGIFSSLIPIDVPNTFFPLVLAKLRKIEAR